MYIMKPFLISVLFFMLMITAVAALAQGVTIDNPLVAGDIPTLVNKIADWLLGIGSVIAVIMVLWSALLFMTSGGNKERVTQARKTLTYAVVGLTVLILAKGVAALIQNFLGGRS